MKKLISLCLILLMSLLLVACGETPSTSKGDGDTPSVVEDTDSAPADVAEENTGEGDLGEYHVRITGYHLAKTYDDKDAVILDYDFTNNGEDAASAMFALSFKLYQNGVELETAIIIDDSYDGDNALKDIKTGVTLSCQCAYELEDTTSPIEVEVSKFISFSKDVVNYVIELGE